MQTTLDHAEALVNQGQIAEAAAVLLGIIRQCQSEQKKVPLRVLALIESAATKDFLTIKEGAR
jgi:hypothetical protein